MIVKGEIRQGDYERLLAFISESPSRFISDGVVLASPGGDVKEAIAIGTLFRKTYRAVSVYPDYGPCASACFFIFVSAMDRRVIGIGKLGIHRPYLDPDQLATLSLADAERAQGEVEQEVRSFLRKREVPEDVMEHMFSLASDEIYWLSKNEIDRIGIRPSWYDQILVAKCGLNKTLEHGLSIYGAQFAQFDEAMGNLRSAYACERRMELPVAAANLKTIFLADARKRYAIAIATDGKNYARECVDALIPAQEGLLPAQALVGACYREGVGFQRDYRSAERWFRYAAEAGDRSAQGELGYMYLTGGEGIGKNTSEAIKWFRKSAQQGSVDSMARLGGLLAYGDGTNADPVGLNPAEGIRWLRKASEYGNSNAQFLLGLAYLRGSGVKVDPVIAYFLISLANRTRENANPGIAFVLHKLDAHITRGQVAEARRLLERWKIGDVIPAGGRVR